MLIFSKIALVFASNHRVILTLVSCSLFLGPIAGGSLSETLGFEWAAAVMCFTGLFAVSYVYTYLYVTNVVERHNYLDNNASLNVS